MNCAFSQVGISLTFLASALLVGAERREHAMRSAPPVVTFGDSVTAARSRIEVYSTLLANELLVDGRSATVINRGIGGNTTKHARERLERDVLAARPGVVVMMFGINDAAIDVWKSPPATAPRVPLSDYRENLVAMIRSLKQQGARVVLMTPNPIYWSDVTRSRYGKPPYRPDDPDGFNVLLRDYARTAREIARTENVGLVDVFAAFEHHESVAKREAGSLARDGMHPDNEGHRIIADLVLEHLTQADSRFTRKAFTKSR